MLRPFLFAAAPAAALPARAGEYTLFIFETADDFAARTDPAMAGTAAS